MGRGQKTPGPSKQKLRAEHLTKKRKSKALGVLVERKRKRGDEEEDPLDEDGKVKLRPGIARGALLSAPEKAPPPIAAKQKNTYKATLLNPNSLNREALLL